MSRLVELDVLHFLKSSWSYLFVLLLSRWASEVNVVFADFRVRSFIGKVFLNDSRVVSVNRCLILVDDVLEVRSDDFKLVLLEELLNQSQRLWCLLVLVMISSTFNSSWPPLEHLVWIKVLRRFQEISSEEHKSLVHGHFPLILGQFLVLFVLLLANSLVLFVDGDKVNAFGESKDGFLLLHVRHIL